MNSSWFLRLCNAARWRAFGALVLFSLMLTISAQAQKRAANNNNQPPPLIDRELFFGDPEITGAQISPDGKYIAFIKPFKGTRNVWVKRTEEPFDSAHPVTNDMKRPVGNYFWTRDGKYILFVQDKGGDENFNVFAVDPSAKPAAKEDVPTARNLTDAKGIRALIYDVPRNEPDVIYVGLNDRDKAWHDLYRVRISTGERTLMRENTDRATAWVFDNAGRLRLASRSTDKGETEILRVDDKGLTKIYSCGVFETCVPVRFHKDNQHFYMVTNRTDAKDLIELVLLDPATGKEELVESDPLKRVDFGDAAFSDVTNEIIATTYDDDRTRVYFHNKDFENDYKFIKKQLGDREIGFDSSTADEQIWLVSSFSDTDPGTKWMYNRKTKKLTELYRSREKLPREALAPMQAIRYKSSDGLEIPAYLTLPRGVPAKNLPLIVNPHGGPWSRSGWGYNTFAQFLANRGYAVLQPNFRASTGYGKKFLNAGNKQWGDLMQDDITWGVKHLVQQGIVDPKRVGIMGGSYGGYATLAGVTYTPDTYAAAVAIVAPSNLITLLETIPPYWESIRTVFYERMGNPNTPEGKAQLMRQSPLSHVEKIKTPLLVVQGANDPRVNKREADQIVVALRDRNYPVEYIVAPDEGHGFARPINNLAMVARAEEFLAKHLGGRYQATLTPEIDARLKEITVDVKTVEVKKMTAASATTAAPKPARDLAPATIRYKANIAVGGQTIPFDVVSTIKEENGMWVVTDTAELPTGSIKDMTVIEKGSLVVKRRVIEQGGAIITLDFKDGKAAGSMSMGGQNRAINVETGGALFADGAGANDVIAALPLAEGYTTTIRNFDVQRGKISSRELKVIGSENITVPAGTFESWKVEITGDDGAKTYIWVDKAKNRAVKATSTLPQAGGAVVTAELQ